MHAGGWSGRELVPQYVFDLMHSIGGLSKGFASKQGLIAYHGNKELLREVRMAASFLGIGIGTSTLKIVYRSGGGVKIISEPLPENTVNEDGISSPQTLVSILSEIRKRERIRQRDVVMVLGDSSAFFRHVTLPPMNEAELRINLPYEFRDYIDEDPETYVYDYAVDEIVRNEEGEPQSLELYASAARRQLIEERAQILRKAGFRLKAIIPAQMAYMRLVSTYHSSHPDEEPKSQVFIDIGNLAVAVHLLQGGKFKASKTIDFGCRDLDMTIADLKGVDRHVASTYKQSNFEGVLDLPECEAVYDRLCFEINKVINFYNFSNQADVEYMYVLGGGSQIKQLMDVMERSFDIPLGYASEVLPPELASEPGIGAVALAVAGLLEGEAIAHGA